MNDKVMAGHKSEALVEYLLKRRSVKTKYMGEPGPNVDELEQILQAGARVPDHGKMCPWYFLVFEGDARVQIGKEIGKAYAKANPDARPDKIEKEEGRFMDAPLVIGVISRMRKGKNPLWEQILSAGASCMNIVLAANGLGYGAQWLTEWYAYDVRVKSAMGLDECDHVAGFIHIGSVKEQPEERDRPDMPLIVNHWSAEHPLKKGELYEREKFDYPEDGFDFSKLHPRKQAEGS